MDQVVGTFNDPEKLNAVLQNAQRHYHLVSPATVCPELPEGFSVIAMVVRVDPQWDVAPADEVAKAQSKPEANIPAEKRAGNFQLSKHMLNRLATAAGVTTDPPIRLDNGRDPRFVEFSTTAHWQTFDMQPIERTGVQRSDLRDGSDETEGYGDKRLRGERATVVAKVQTKSELRAIRAILALKTGYTMEELRRPFLVVKLIADPRRIEDPETRRLVILERQRLAMGGHRALFGSPAPVQLQAPRAHAALPAGSHIIDAEVEEPAPAAPPPRPAPAARPPRPLTMPGGDDKGKPLDQASTSSLKYWVDRIAGNLDAGTARNPDYDRRLLEGMQSELIKRGEATGDEDEREEGFGPDDDEGEPLPEDIFNTAPRGPRY